MVLAVVGESEFHENFAWRHVERGRQLEDIQQ